MPIRVLCRIDAHEYDRRSGRRASSCRACDLEQRIESSVDEAAGDQPADDVTRPDGDKRPANNFVRRTLSLRDLDGDYDLDSSVTRKIPTLEHNLKIMRAHIHERFRVEPSSLRRISGRSFHR
jgi:hypothetical protein